MATPWSSFDTTLPSLQEIGFQILLGPEYGAVHGGSYPTTVLGGVAASPNPFNRDAEITYTMNVPATLTVEVFDPLGKKVESPVPSVFTPIGDRTLTLSGSLLPSGTYYIRFSVPEGEVKTVKVVKE